MQFGDVDQKKNAAVHVDGTFHDQLYHKKYYLINLDKMKFVLFFKILTFCCSFGIKNLKQVFKPKVTQKLKILKNKNNFISLELKTTHFYFNG